MCRVSSAGVLVGRGFCANPAIIPSQKPQKGDYVHVEGCPLMKVLQQGFGRSTAENRGLGGDIRLKSGGHLVLFLLLSLLL